MDTASTSAADNNVSYAPYAVSIPKSTANCFALSIRRQATATTSDFSESKHELNHGAFDSSVPDNPDAN